MNENLDLFEKVINKTIPKVDYYLFLEFNFNIWVVIKGILFLFLFPNISLVFKYNKKYNSCYRFF